MPDWPLTVLRLPWALVRTPWRWIRRKAADHQTLVAEGGDVVAAIQEFLRSATPLNVSMETYQGDSKDRLNEARVRLRKYTNGHRPSAFAGWART